MSDGDGISNRPGPASAAEPSMEEILASIRRILSEEEGGAKRQAASDELLLRASMRVLSPELPASATEPPRMQDPVIAPEEPPLPQPGHFAQAPSFEPPPALEPAPITLHVEPEPVPTPVWQQSPFPPADEQAPPAEPDYSQEPAEPAYSQEPAAPADFQQSAAPFYESAPAQSAYQPPPQEPIYQSPQPPSIFSAQPAPETLFPMQAQPSYFDPQPSQKDETMDEQFQGPEGLVGDQAVSDISNSIGALVRSVSAERAAGVGRAGVTIEDIVREEMKPVLKAWLDTHLPSLVERMVRAEINRVIEQAQR